MTTRDLKERVQDPELFTLAQILDMGFIKSSSNEEYFRIIGENGVQGARLIGDKYKLYTIREDDPHAKDLADLIY